MDTQAPITHILAATTIRRERLLPIAGRVVMRKGQQVNSSDVVAEAFLSPEHLLLDIGRGLGLKADEADKYLVRKDGDEVGEGDILAGPVGVARRLVRAPKSGTVIAAGEGQVLLRVDMQPFELRAGYCGTVAELLSDQGVTIETTGALIQGVWGNGRMNYGLLNILAHSPDELITANMLDVSQRGSVLLGGYCDSEDVFRTGEELPLRGMILASMSSALIPAASQASYPVILVEGFGRLPMNSSAYKLLSTSERREVSLNAERWDRFAGTRPEIVISLPSQVQADLPLDLAVFKTNQQVRVVSPPYKGRLATLISLSDGPVNLPSGLRTLAGTVRFEDGETVLLPLANLEIIQ
jgi:hypothetical protein